MSVYFISCREIDMVKIGYAWNPVARLKHLQVACPLILTLEGAIPGGFDKEHELHRRYHKWRVRGEWFTLTPSIQDEIAGSTRPDKFTWQSVKKWMQSLAAESDRLEREADMQCEARRAVILTHEQEVTEALKRAARRSRMTELERLEADGHIHFPFREPAEADC